MFTDAQEPLFKPNLKNEKNKRDNPIDLSFLKKIPEKYQLQQPMTTENTCEINLDDLRGNILLNRNPFVKSAVNYIENILKTHPALLEENLSIEEDLAK